MEAVRRFRIPDAITVLSVHAVVTDTAARIPHFVYSVLVNHRRSRNAPFIWRLEINTDHTSSVPMDAIVRIGIFEVVERLGTAVNDLPPESVQIPHLPETVFD